MWHRSVCGGLRRLGGAQRGTIESMRRSWVGESSSPVSCPPGAGAAGDPCGPVGVIPRGCCCWASGGWCEGGGGPVCSHGAGLLTQGRGLLGRGARTAAQVLRRPAAVPQRAAQAAAAPVAARWVQPAEGAPGAPPSGPWAGGTGGAVRSPVTGAGADSRGAAAAIRRPSARRASSTHSSATRTIASVAASQAASCCRCGPVARDSTTPAERSATSVGSTRSVNIPCQVRMASSTRSCMARSMRPALP